MDHSRILPLPTPLNAQRAWEEYQALVLAALEDASLWADLKHSMAMCRARARWEDLFLATERAA